MLVRALAVGAAGARGLVAAGRRRVARHGEDALRRAGVVGVDGAPLAIVADRRRAGADGRSGLQAGSGCQLCSVHTLVRIRTMRNRNVLMLVACAYYARHSAGGVRPMLWLRIGRTKIQATAAQQIAALEVEQSSMAHTRKQAQVALGRTMLLATKTHALP